ncbi:L-tyrosine/L-tryptophan isonitrile synthase family protein [Legionella norrlandica]|uniref:L-tyrosine/L-tryptophan isonitrile synthase family protein n=1 Tax=Legionella norrlandica TaxID=1498499 RepID=UPI000AB2A849|nr:L-tyrosine/L-tryptophan isonitrile synthase family protein [Legionella norrlandica]
MKNTAFSLIAVQNHSIKNSEFKKSSDSDSAMEMAKRILAEFMIFRRVPEISKSCKHTDCQKCLSPHLPKVISAVEKHKPVIFVLPAFPGKSPNPEKVLGPLPDFAERLALNFLGNLCQRIKKFYTPGIKIILCSDGRVFSDVVGMKESNVTAYQVELDRLIEGMSLRDISTFNLDDFYKDLNFVQMRNELMKSYEQSLDFLKHKVRNGAKSSASQMNKKQIVCTVESRAFYLKTPCIKTKRKVVLLSRKNLVSKHMRLSEGVTPGVI